LWHTTHAYRSCCWWYVPLASNNYGPSWQPICWWGVSRIHSLPTRLPIQATQGNHYAYFSDTPCLAFLLTPPLFLPSWTCFIALVHFIVLVNYLHYRICFICEFSYLFYLYCIHSPLSACPLSIIAMFSFVKKMGVPDTVISLCLVFAWNNLQLSGEHSNDWGWLCVSPGFSLFFFLSFLIDLLDCQSVPVCRTRNAHPGVSYGIHGGASYHPP
jgi:hypothetical protein